MTTWHNLYRDKLDEIIPALSHWHPLACSEPEVLRTDRWYYSLSPRPLPPGAAIYMTPGHIIVRTA